MTEAQSHIDATDPLVWDDDSIADEVLFSAIAQHPLSRFLFILETLVLKEQNPSGVSGRICIGVCSPEKSLWLRIHLGRSPHTEWAPQPDPAQDDAIMMISDRDAAHILDAGTLPAEPELLRINGDRKLLQGFVSRYLSPRNLLDIRMGN